MSAIQPPHMGWQRNGRMRASSSKLEKTTELPSFSVISTWHFLNISKRAFASANIFANRFTVREPVYRAISFNVLPILYLGGPGLLTANLLRVAPLLDPDQVSRDGDNNTNEKGFLEERPALTLVVQRQRGIICVVTGRPLSTPQDLFCSHSSSASGKLYFFQAEWCTAGALGHERHRTMNDCTDVIDWLVVCAF